MVSIGAIHHKSNAMSNSDFINIENVLAYKNNMVVHKFLESYNMPFEDAEDIFMETKKWLWLCGKAIHQRKNGLDCPPLLITQELFIIDEMWHTFILFTREYSSFCKKYFTHYIHHSPTTKLEKEEFAYRKKNAPQELAKEIIKKRELQYNYIYENLGRETLIKWYSLIPDQYNKNLLLKR